MACGICRRSPGHLAWSGHEAVRHATHQPEIELVMTSFRHDFRFACKALNDLPTYLSDQVPPRLPCAPCLAACQLRGGVLGGAWCAATRVRVPSRPMKTTLADRRVPSASVVMPLLNRRPDASSHFSLPAAPISAPRSCPPYRKRCRPSVLPFCLVRRRRASRRRR